MARKKRDYKAEYAAAKRRATRAGYKSEREYKTTRKLAQLPPRTSLVPKRIFAGNDPALRQEAREWSAIHSRRPNSKYRENMSDDQVRRYHKAFVEPLDEVDSATTREKLKRIKAFMVPEIVKDDEWATNPSTVPLRR
jgi:hypothetical protein